MRTWWVATLALISFSCGGVGPERSGTDPEPVGSLPWTAQGNLWPLTPGSSWTYRITDPADGPSSKEVSVQGTTQVPGTSVSAISVVSVQPHIEERSWQTVAEGKVLRLREEDRKAGEVVRVITWEPSLMMKALAEAKPAGWTETVTLVENERDETTGALIEKEKVYAWAVEALGESISTPAGTFSNAIRLLRTRPDKADWEPRTYWLVPGVGKVREEGERTEELVRYDVK